MLTLDVAKTNEEVYKLLDKTENPRHRYMLIAYARHRALEVSGLHEQVTDEILMVDVPIYKLQSLGFNVVLKSKDVIRNMYSMWAQTNQSIFFQENEQVAVSDNFITSVLTLYQQVSGRTLKLSRALKLFPRAVSNILLPRIFAIKNWKSDNNDMYLVKSFVESTWLYDERCRLMSEHVWEPSEKDREIIKLKPYHVTIAG